MSLKRRRPRTVDVLGQKFKIRYKHEDDMEDCLGITFTASREIWLQDGLPADQMRRVLIHEITHAILGISGITEKLNPQLEEAICCAFESGIYSYRPVNRVHG
jgi:hypothetical protein